MRELSISQFGEDWSVTLVDTDGASFQFVFSEIERLKRTETNVFLDLSIQIPGAAHEQWCGRMNLASPSARKDLAATLRGITGEKRPYEAILSQVVATLLDRLNEVKSALPVTEISPEVATSGMLFAPFITDNSANLIFGNGESTKTFITARIAISLVTGLPFLGKTPSRKARVLFLDYEDRAGKFADRIMRIVSGMKPAPAMEDLEGLSYMKPNGTPLPDLVHSIKREMERTKSEVLLIDSAGYAAGSELERAEVVIRYFNALDAIGKTSLAIAHVSKGSMEDEGGQKYALGSIYFHNAPRNTWNVVKLGGENDEEPVKKICMFHRKCNDGPRHPMIPLEVDFSVPNVVSFHPGDMDDWEDKQNLAQRIKGLLKSGPMGRKGVCDSFQDEKPRTVQTTLSRLVKKGEIILLGGQGGEYVIKR